MHLDLVCVWWVDAFLHKVSSSMLKEQIFLLFFSMGSNSSNTLPLRKVSLTKKRLKSPLKPFQKDFPTWQQQRSVCSGAKKKKIQNKPDLQHFSPAFNNPHLSPDCHTAMLSTQAPQISAERTKMCHERRRGNIHFVKKGNREIKMRTLDVCSSQQRACVCVYIYVFILKHAQKKVHHSSADVLTTWNQKKLNLCRQHEYFSTNIKCTSTNEAFRKFTHITY